MFSLCTLEAKMYNPQPFPGNSRNRLNNNNTSTSTTTTTTKKIDLSGEQHSGFPA
jgi:hypothetical protein